MAQTFNIGKAPVGILDRALTGNIFIEKSLAYMNEGDRDGYTAYKHDIRNTLRARTANPAAATNTSTAKKEAYKRSLSVLESYEEFDPSEYYSYWLEYQPSGEFQWEGLPSEVQMSFENLFLGTAAEAVEDGLTNGITGEVVGLIPQLRSNGLTSLNGVTATAEQVVANTHTAFTAHGGGVGDNLGVALTSTNILEKMELLVKKQTKDMRKRTSRKFMVSHGTADIFREALRLGLQFKGVEVSEEGFLRYAGYEIVENPSFPDNDILFCNMSGDFKSDAIQLGTSSSADFNNLEVDRVANFGRHWGMCLTFALDIFLVRPEETCYYTAATIV